MEAVTTLERQSQTLAERYRGLDGEALLRPLITGDFAGRIAVLSSFGAESALLLHMVADGELRIDTSDEIQSGVVVAHDGRVVHPAVAKLLAGEGGR